MVKMMSSVRRNADVHSCRPINGASWRLFRVRTRSVWRPRSLTWCVSRILELIVHDTASPGSPRKVSTRYAGRDAEALAKLEKLAAAEYRRVRWRDCFRLASLKMLGDSSVDADAKRLWRKARLAGIAEEPMPRGWKPKI